MLYLRLACRTVVIIECSTLHEFYVLGLNTSKQKDISMLCHTYLGHQLREFGQAELPALGILCTASGITSLRHSGKPEHEFVRDRGASLMRPICKRVSVMPVTGKLS